MRLVQRSIYSGAVLEKEIYPISDRARRPRTAAPELRFEDEAQRIAHKEGIARRRYVRLFNANFSPSSIYATLTFSADEEVHTFEEAQIIQNAFLRRVRYKYPDAVITLVKGRGKHTHRIHFHMVSDGIPMEAVAGDEKRGIKPLWIYGKIIEAEHLRKKNYVKVDGKRIDVGQDYSGLATYLFEHWTPEQGGHRYYFSRNRVDPQKDPENGAKDVPAEEVKEIRHRYSRKNPPSAPRGYRLIDAVITTYGYKCFRYVYDPPEGA